MCGLVHNEWMVARDINRLVQTTQNLRRFSYGPVAATLQQVSNAGYITGNQPITISGDVDGTGTTAITLTLDTVNSNVGTFQGITVNGKGLVTAASNQSYLTANQTITLSGDLSGSGTTAIDAQIAANAVGTAEIANANVTYAKIQNVANNRVLGNTSGAAAAPSEIVLPLAVANGGTGVVTAAAAPWVGVGGDTMSGALAILAGDLTVNAAIFAGDGVSTGDAILGVGRGRVGSGNAYLDLHGQSGTAFDLRLIRAAGANGNAVLQNNGTGSLQLTAVSQALVMLGTGNVGISTASPGSTLDVNGTISAASKITTNNGWTARAGTAGPNRSNVFNIDWTPANLWIDNVNQGAITVTCDYRIKDNIAELPSTWDAVKALRPISYNYKACPELLREAVDPAERWGFLAHELQQALLPTAASGEKDMPNVVQSPDLVAVCAALTRALQEAMARIESLE